MGVFSSRVTNGRLKMLGVVVGLALVVTGLYVMANVSGIDMIGGLIILVDGCHLLIRGIIGLYRNRLIKRNLNLEKK